MRRISLSAAVLLAVITGPLSGCAHTGGLAATRAQKVEAKYDVARLAESDGQLDKARDGYEAIYKKDPSIADVCHRLGIVHAKQTNYEAAKRYLDEAHKLNPSDPEILNDLGYACYLSGDLKMAETVFETALKISKDNKRATNNLALVLGSQGRFEDSYRMFRQVNTDAEAHSNVAYLYAQNGEGKKALEHYSRALTLNPELKHAANAMLEIATLQQKMESDRAQIAQQQQKQQPQQATVAQVAAQAQPKVYQQLTAAAARPAVDAPVTPVAAPATEVAVARPAASAAAEDFADETEDNSRRNVLPASKSVEIKTVKSVAQIDKTRTAEKAFTDEVDQELPELKPVETQAEVVRNQRTEVVPAPVADASTSVSEFDEPSVEKQAQVITPVQSSQAEVNVAEIVTPQPETQTPVDYLALCPQASDNVRPLLVQLNTLDGSQMKLALHKLGELATEGQSAAPAVRAATKNSDAYVRIHAALALWRIEQNSQETVPVFVDGLQNSDANVRSFAATAVAMGPQAEEFIAPLTVTLSDVNPFVRLHSAETLYKYPGHENVSTQAMIAHLSDKDANVRWLATFIMGESLPRTPEAVHALTLALRDSDHRIRTGAAFALGGLGRDAQAALPELQQLSDDKNPEVRKSVQEAIHEIQQNAAQASTIR